MATYVLHIALYFRIVDWSSSKPPAHANEESQQVEITGCWNLETTNSKVGRETDRAAGTMDDFTHGRRGGTMNDFIHGRHRGRTKKQCEAKQQHESSNGIETYTGNFESRKFFNANLKLSIHWKQIQSRRSENRKIGAEDEI